KKVLEARIFRRKLKYRVKWLSYDNNLKWYNAANFKNSPHKLYAFYRDDLTRPGPPKRLDH
ncbi:hypothetical protein K458DRAFT_288283, partial [Lentithecium fluviatile CBS 122367]